jgi:pectate lyase
MINKSLLKKKGNFMSIKERKKLLILTVIIFIYGGITLWGNDNEKEKGRYIPAIREFADNILEYGRDHYGKKHSPLFVDGINVTTKEGVKVENMVMCNVASQQYLMRYLCALSALTGDKKYKKAAIDAMRYFLRDKKGRKLLQGDPQGRKELPKNLLPWGGHSFYDLEADRVSGKLVHELKNHSPYYDLMWEADKKRAALFIKAFWRNHIYDWRNLNFNRHSDSGHITPSDKRFWLANKDKYKGGPLPIPSGAGSFFYSGMDLCYAAACYYKFSGDKDALLWAKRLAGRYMEARDKKTGLGGDMLSWNDKYSSPLAPLYPGHKIIDWATMTLEDRRYNVSAVSRMRIYEMLGPEDGREFLTWTLEDLKAYGKWAYDEKDNSFWCMITDGTKIDVDYLKDYLKKTGSGAFEPTAYKKKYAGGSYFYAYALAYRLSKDKFMLEMCKKMMKFYKPGGPSGIHGLIELYKATKDKKYLDMAIKIGDGYLNSFHNGFFVSPTSRNCKFSHSILFALLRLDAVILGMEDKIPIDFAAAEGFLGLPKGKLYTKYIGVGPAYNRLWSEKKEILIRGWLVTGPFSNKDDKGFERIYEPEKEPEKTGGYKVLDGKKAAWTEAVIYDSGYLYLPRYIKPNKKVIAYAKSQIISPLKRKVTFLVRNGAGIKIWVNGKSIIKIKEKEKWVDFIHSHWFDTSDADWWGDNLPVKQYKVELKKGRNDILVKVEQYPAIYGGVLRFSLSILDIPKQIKGLQFKPDLKKDWKRQWLEDLEDKDIEIREEAVKELWRLVRCGERKKVLSSLIGYLKKCLQEGDDDISIKKADLLWDVIRLTGKYKRTIPFINKRLIKCLKNKDDSIYFKAVYMLGKIIDAGKGKNAVPVLVQYLTKSLGNKKKDICLKAANQLKILIINGKGKQAIPSLLECLKLKGDGRWKAAEALGMLKQKEVNKVLPQLLKILKKSKDKEARLSVIYAFGIMKKKAMSTKSLLIKILLDEGEDIETRETVMWSLTNIVGINDPEIIEVFIKVMEKDRNMRLNIINTLFNIESPTPELLASLGRMLKDKDKKIRETAEKTIKYLNPKKD